MTIRPSLSLLALAAALGCSATDGDTVAKGVPNGGAGGGSAGSGGGAAASSSGGSGAVDSGTPPGDSGIVVSNDAGGDPDAACALSSIKAQLVPLDLYILLDRSGSMTIPTSTGVSKWDAVKNALSAFFADPKSSGISVGLQFFPTRVPGVPADCTVDSQCGAYGPCMLRACENSPGVMQGCHTDADCNGYGPCSNLGACDGDITRLCFPGMECNCQILTKAFCEKQDSCVPDDYAAPKVAIAPLPGSGASIVAAMAAELPTGATPTGPALAGAVKEASGWQKAHPDHVVAVVLATDGMPTECAPQDIGSIAQTAADAFGATPSLRTYVIGVLGGADVPANADQIAAAGGTQQAFLVDPYQNVEQGFHQALDAIRSSVLGCQFVIPLPVSGGTVDYDRVNVTYTDASGNVSTLFYVADADHCDPQTGGWYYDVDPASGAKPTQIIACKTSCDGFDESAGSVDIAVGCKTLIATPK